MPYLSIEKPLYSACLRRLPPLPLWSSEESSITTKEVTFLGYDFHNCLLGEWFVARQENRNNFNMFRMRGVRPTDVVDGQAYLGQTIHMTHHFLRTSHMNELSSRLHFITPSDFIRNSLELHRFERGGTDCLGL